MNVNERFNSTVTLQTDVSNSDEEDHPFKSEEMSHSAKQEDREIVNSNTNFHNTQESSSTFDNKELPINTTGVLMSIYLNTCFYYCFAVQETITTPMVMKFITGLRLRLTCSLLPLE